MGSRPSFRLQRSAHLLPLALTFLLTLTTAQKLVNGVAAGTDVAAGADAAPDEAGNCGFEGNQDVYGLGIRLGLYSQWLSTLISNFMHTQNLTRMRDINTMFSLAMSIALIALSTATTKPRAIEMYIIIMQIVGSSCTISAQATHKSKWGETSWGGVIRFMIYFVVAAYSTFFWFRDVNLLQPLPAGCEAYGFMFIKVPLLKPWFRTTHKIICSLALLVFTTLFGYISWQHGSSFVDRSFVGTHRLRKKGGFEGLLADAIDPNVQIPVVHKFTPILCIVILGVSISAIEALILWNGITRVNDALSTGQLIPLVTGVGGLIRVLYLMYSTPGLKLHVIRQERNVSVGRQQAGAGQKGLEMARPGQRGPEGVWQPPQGAERMV